MNVNKNTVIELKLVKQDIDAQTFVIGNLKSNIYLEVPLEALYIIEMCDGLNTINDIESKIFEKYNCNIEVKSFIEDLISEGLVYSINGQIIGEDNEIIRNNTLEKVAHIMFNNYMHLFYIGLMLINSFLIFFQTSNLPNYNSAIIIDKQPGLSLLIFILVSWSITGLHEIGHFLAAVELKIPVKIKLNLRLLFLVVESDINGVWSVEKNKRYICYMGGIYMESIILNIFLTLKTFVISNLLFIKISNAIILIIFLNFIWQFMIFIRTDLYLMIFNFLNITSLHDSSINYIKAKFLLQEKENKQSKTIIIYSIVYCLGIIFSIVYGIYNILIYYNLIKISISSIKSNTWIIFMDSVMLLGIILASSCLWIIGLSNKLKELRL